MNNNRQPAADMRIVPAVFGAIFAAIGVTVIVFLWTDDDFGAPVFFSVFGSLIGLAFVVFGGAMAIGAMTGGVFRHSSHLPNAASPSPSSAAYVCPRCGAPLAKDADVSPMGDVRCGHCNGWFNIHRSARPG